jgi:hypothetical protein
MLLKNRILLIIIIIVCITLVTGCLPGMDKVDSDSEKNMNDEGVVTYDAEEIPDSGDNDLKPAPEDTNEAGNNDVVDMKFSYTIVDTAQTNFYDNQSEIEPLLMQVNYSTVRMHNLKEFSLSIQTIEMVP